MAHITGMSTDQPSNTPHRNSPEYIEFHIKVARDELPALGAEANALMELATNAERVGTSADPRTLTRARELLANVARWQVLLEGWEAQDSSKAQSADLRVLRCTLDATSGEADTAVSGFHLIEA